MLGELFVPEVLVEYVMLIVKNSRVPRKLSNLSITFNDQSPFPSEPLPIISFINSANDVGGPELGKYSQITSVRQIIPLVVREFPIFSAVTVAASVNRIGAPALKFALFPSWSVVSPPG